MRSRIMPVNRKYPLRCYSKLAITKSRKKRSMMFDYILIAGVTSRDFRQLAGLLVGVVDAGDQDVVEHHPSFFHDLVIASFE